MSEPTQHSAARSNPDDAPSNRPYTPPDRPFDVWLAVRVPIMAPTMEKAERQAFDGVSEVINYLVLTNKEAEASAEAVTMADTQTEQTGQVRRIIQNDPVVLHFGEVAIRTLNQMNQEQRGVEADGKP